ncbi:NTP transferase domain-containing protein [Streptomyces sp. N35]|uniref:NTP transferase domain-containing protein n=1 Tax=Streptomyces sp. N35 TaxID=2795730 RepID=UPI0018F3F2AF|nr:NTP transferase domain-containing protein [Streptomyces sp. N35]
MTSYDAVVLAGGAAKRLGGVDKPAVRVGGRPLLDRVLTACAAAGTTVVVAPPRPTVRPVVWAREEPAGGGPLAALAAGVEALEQAGALEHAGSLGHAEESEHAGDSDHAVDPGHAPDSDHAASPNHAADPGHAPDPGHAASPDRTAGPERTADPDRTADDRPVLVLSSDLPFLAEPAVDLLIGALHAAETAAGAPFDGALFTDPTGHDQPLVAVYRRSALRHGLDRLRAEHGSFTGLPLRLLTTGLALTRVTEPEGSRAAFDCDTWEDIAAARARIREHERVLDEWITAVKDELGLDLDVDTALLLDLARDAAHGVARRAARSPPLRRGTGAARRGGGPEAAAEATRKAVALAARWADEDRPDSKPADPDATPDAE